MNFRKHPLSTLSLCCLLILVSLAMFSGGCVRGEPPPPPVASSGTITSGQEDIVLAWEGSKHADTHVLGVDGLNNSCADCHSPLNWLPTDKDDLPESCSSCLVPFELKEPTEPVAEADWKSVECNICHVIKAGSAASLVSWLDMKLTQPGEPGIYDAISTDTELCEKCHQDNDTFSYKRDLGSLIHSSRQCTDCHDAHSLEADCVSCHTGAIAAHDGKHAIVGCVACHDASGLEAGPVEGDGRWLALRNGDPYVSHNLQLEVDCARCHYAGNSWGLSLIAE